MEEEFSAVARAMKSINMTLSLQDEKRHSLADARKPIRRFSRVTIDPK
jgi:hypothetical protein